MTARMRRPRRGALGWWSIVGAMVGVVAAVPTGAEHVHGTASPRQNGTDRLEISIVSQSFAVRAGGDLGLSIEISGQLPPRPEPPDLVPPDLAPPNDTNDTITTDGTNDTGTPAAAAEDDRAPGADADADADASDVDDDAGPAPWIEIVVGAHEPLERREQVLPAAAGVLGPEVASVRYALGEDDPPLVELAIPVAASDDETNDADEDTDRDTADGDGPDSDSDPDTPGPTVLVLERPGLYPISVDLVHDGHRLARAITFVERLPADGEPTTRTRPYQLVVVATVDDPGPEPDPLDVVAARSRVLEILENADAIDEPISVVVPPLVLDALVEDPAIGPRLATGLAGDELVAFPEMTLDPSSAAAADVGDAFVRELRRGEDLLNSAAPTAFVQRSAWVTTSAPSTTGAALLRDLGVRLLVVPLATYHALDGSLHPGFTDPSSVYPVALPGDGTMNLAVVDPVSRWIDPGRSDGRTATEAAAVAFAELSATRIQLRDATRLAVLSTETFEPPDADVLAEIERMARDHPAFTFQTLSTVSSTTDTIPRGPGSEPVLLPASAGIDLRPRARSLADARAGAAPIASMIPDGDPRPEEWSAELDRWLSTGFTDAEVRERLERFDAELAAIPASIIAPEPFTFTLTGTESEITLRISNEASEPLRVMIHAEASKLRFPDGDVVVDLAPGTNTVDLPVRTLSNGTFTVNIELLTPDGTRPVTEPVVLTARVTALTGIGQVLTGGLILVLATWWISHLRGARRARRRAARIGSTNRHPCTHEPSDAGANGAGDSVASP